MGLAIIDVGHFNSEWPIVKRLSEKVKEALNDEEVEIVIAKNVRDPYCYF